MIVLPNLAKDLFDKELPNTQLLNTENASPKVVGAHTDIALPQLKKLLTDRELPKAQLPSIDDEEPNTDLLYKDNELPSRANDLKEKELATKTACEIEAIPPVFKSLLTSKD